MSDLSDLKKNTAVKLAGSVLGAAVLLYCLWYFRFYVGCVFIALILSLIGRPLADFLEKIKIGKLRLSKGLCAIITLIAEFGVIALAVYLFVPMVITQAMNFSNMDTDQLSLLYSSVTDRLDPYVIKYHLLPQGSDINTYLGSMAMDVMNSIQLPKLASVIISFGVSLFMGTLIVAFVTFFFLKDSHLARRIIDTATPDRYLEEVHHIITNSRKLISRYFVGIFAEIVAITALLSLGFFIAGFDNFILIACICGVMVIIPYIGVIIGGGVGLMILLTGFLSANPGAEIMPVIIEYIAIFAAVKLMDDFLLQPLIYSKSVKAHPLEIFFVILLSGKVGGIAGMILAVPVYTFIRIIAKEFFNKWKIIKAITKEID